ncbi:DUF202 domain-containing protein [Yinghuangia seranimata]|uniref:DUF202 domain-containing protein n=1 Tax=Yinghuangia seranimata TaxID=408067 RepID=UPI00248B8E23|nr:DUF202 domain-containing protein [Yinghuangia seranimata]MDI2126413.1 DUF202 domain-containing protein [Yinghuangia seranimata]
MTTAPRDPGLQQERTRLAWSRTALAFAANGGLLLHAGHERDAWPWLLPGALVIALSLLVYLAGLVRAERVERALRAGAPVHGGRLIVAVGAAATLVSVFGVVMLATRA